MRNTKSKIIIVMCILLCVMVVGYSAFNAALTITGTANIASEWKVVFTDITQVSKTSGVTIKSNPSASGTTATFNVGLTSPGDKIEYKITVANQGNIDAVIEDIRINETGNDAIIFNVTNIEIGDTLLGESSTTFNVSIEYNSNVTSQPSNLTNTLTISVDYIQYVGGNSGGSSTAVVFNKETPNSLTFTSEEEVSTFREVKVDNKTVDSSNYTVTSGSTIITLKKEYLQTLTAGTHTMDIVSTTGTTTKTFEVTTTKSSTNLAEKILSDNEVYADNVASKYVTASTGIDFSAISSDTNGKGLYYTSTNTEDNKTSYYFRGAVENNYVQFGKDSSGNDILWRIVRINEDGSIRIIYNGTSTTATGSSGTIGFFPYNDGDNMQQTSYSSNLYSIIPLLAEPGTISDDNSFVGYMYGTAGSSTYEETHKNTNNSTIKGVIDTWYNSNLSSYSSYLADAGFCNDRSVAPSAGLWSSSDKALGYAQNYTVYGASGRLADIDNWTAKENAQPQFKCPNEERDLFTTSASSKGNKALTYPIGLLTADEVAYAGAALNQTNESMYLTNGMDYWTMSPFFFAGVNALEWSVGSDGHDYVSNEVGVRPVVNLQSEVEIIGGDGTALNPYIIK